MNKAFTNFEWKDEPNHSTPLSAENLNKINNGLDTVDDRVISLDTNKANTSDVYTKTESDANYAPKTSNNLTTTDKSVVGAINELDSTKSEVTVSSSGTATDTVQYITVNGVEKKLAGSSGGGTWGSIQGQISSQTDLWNQLTSKQAKVYISSSAPSSASEGDWWLDTDEWGSGSVRTASVSLPSASWTGSASPYSQTITITGSTSNSKIDLQPSNTVLQQMLDDGTLAMYVENNNNVLTAYALGDKPTTNLTVQATLTEVSA